MTVLALSLQSSYQIHFPARTMREFLVNVTRYPRYLIAFGLGVLNSVAQPLVQRLSNPVTAVALIGALISGFITLVLVLRAMVTTTATLS